MTFTSADLALVRGFCYRYSRNFGAWGNEDDVISDSLLKLSKLELPEDKDHRKRTIYQVCRYTAIDVARKYNSFVKNAKLDWQAKYNKSLADKIKPKRRYKKSVKQRPVVETCDMSAEWVKGIATAPADHSFDGINLKLAIRVLAGQDKTRAMAVYLYYIEDLKMAEVGERMMLSESRVCQIMPSALVMLRKIIEAGKAQAA